MILAAFAVDFGSLASDWSDGTTTRLETCRYRCAEHEGDRLWYIPEKNTYILGRQMQMTVA